MKTIKVLLPLFSILLIISCTPVQNRNAVSHIDSLLTVSKDLNQELNCAEIDTFKMIYDTVVKYNAIFINQHIPNLSKKDLDIVYQYGTIDKALKKFLNKHRGNLMNGLEHRTHQLTTLKHDISNKIIEPEEFSKYLQIEDSLLNNLKDEVDSRMEFAKSHKDKFYVYHKKVLALFEKSEIEFEQ